MDMNPFIVVRYLQNLSRASVLAMTMCAALLSTDAAFTQTTTSPNACSARGESLNAAKAAYAAMCKLPRLDCDPIGSEWICSSENLLTNQSSLLPLQSADTALEATRQASPVLGSNGFPGTGNVGGTPICLDSSNAINGYSFENNQSCVVVQGVTASRNNPLIGNRICSSWMEIGYGNYVLQNNVWNEDGVFSDNWTQCIQLDGGPGNYVAKWDYNWLGRAEGEEYAVKSYPQVYYGRKTQFNQSGTVAETGLPVPINQLPDMRVDFKYSETGNAERNVALESFLHTSCDATEENKHFEMMVWVDSPSIRTPGTLVSTANIDGRVWDVYTNPQLSWGYVAFVAQQPLTEGSLDWNAFVDWSRFQGPAFGVASTGNNTCLGAVEIGTETFWGNGTFTLDRFNVTIGR